MADGKEALTFAVEIGDALLQSGGEVYRVEDTIRHLLNALGVQEFDVYVLSNGIFASANESREDGCSMIRHVPLGETHFGKIAALNQLSREICEHACAIEEAWERLSQCKAMPSREPETQKLCCGVGCACFCALFGGRALDAGVTFFLGCLLQGLIIRNRQKGSSKFLTNITGSAFLTASSLLLLHLRLPILQDKIVIGGIVPLLPGIALTTSIRDLFNGDYLSGAIHLLDALLTAMCIAIGVGCVIILYQQLARGGMMP